MLPSIVTQGFNGITPVESITHPDNYNQCNVGRFRRGRWRCTQNTSTPILFLYGEWAFMEAKDRPGHCLLLSYPYPSSCTERHCFVAANAEEEGFMHLGNLSLGEGGMHLSPYGSFCVLWNQVTVDGAATWGEHRYGLGKDLTHHGHGLSYEGERWRYRENGGNERPSVLRNGKGWFLFDPGKGAYVGIDHKKMEEEHPVI